MGASEADSPRGRILKMAVGELIEKRSGRCSATDLRRTVTASPRANPAAHSPQIVPSTTFHMTIEATAVQSRTQIAEGTSAPVRLVTSRLRIGTHRRRKVALYPKPKPA